MRSILIALLLANWTVGADVLATRLDGGTITGTLQSWDDRRAVLVTAEGEQSLPADELLSLRWEPAPGETSDAQQAGQLELVDGTLLPIDAIECRGAKAVITPDRPIPSPNKEALPKKLVVAVRLQPLEAEAAKQWQEIRDLNSAADVLIVLKRDGKSLDYVECVLGDVTPEKIEFELDGETESINREKVAGFIYYRRQQDAAAEPRLAIKSRTGLQANATTARLDNGTVRLTTPAGAEIDWPLEDIYLADFSAGKLLYLSDVTPASEHWTPLVGFPSGAEVAARYGEPRRDKSAYGGSLTLPSDDVSSNSSSAATRTFAKGLAIRSRTELVYRLPAGFRRFNAIAGIDPAARSSGNVRLEIFGDDRPLLQTDVAGTDAPNVIDLDITEIKRLRLVVDYGTNLDTGDWLNLCDAKVIK